ncbi:hypothetical protein STRTUCAR8_02351, partial [Streptomyces turgidiscabies Car8]
AVRDVHQLVVAVLELPAGVVVADELHRVQLMVATDQGAQPGLVGGGFEGVRADHVDAARRVGRREKLDRGGAQRVGDLLQGAAAGPRPLVLDLAQEGHRQAAAFGHDGKGELQGPAPPPDGRAHPQGLFFVVAHSSGSLLGSSSSRPGCVRPITAHRAVCSVAVRQIVPEPRTTRSLMTSLHPTHVRQTVSCAGHIGVTPRRVRPSRFAPGDGPPSPSSRPSPRAGGDADQRWRQAERSGQGEGLALRGWPDPCRTRNRSVRKRREGWASPETPARTRVPGSAHPS